jgi:hypothetical protein
MLIQLQPLKRQFTELTVDRFGQTAILMASDIVLGEGLLAVLARLFEMHLLNVLLFIVDIDELAALAAFTNVAPTVGVMAVDFG